MMLAEAIVPLDRKREGVFTIWRDAGSIEVVAHGRCYAKADSAGAARHGNPTRDPLLPYGDFPTGHYKVREHDPQSPRRSYGQAPVVVLTAVRGPCKRAIENGRTGIWSHEGDLDVNGYLRATYGCLRLDPWLQWAFVRAIRDGLTDLIARGL